MSTKPTPTGYVPVTIHLPADLAARFQQTNYNWTPLITRFIEDSTPADEAHWLLGLYFHFSRLLTLNPEEITPDSVEQLYSCQQLFSAISAISDMESEPIDDLKP